MSFGPHRIWKIRPFLHISYNMKIGCRQKGRTLEENGGSWDGEGRRGETITRVEEGMNEEREGREKIRKEGRPT